jgi:hypothetical protein
MKALKCFLWTLGTVAFALGLAWVTRYEYLTVPDTSFKSNLMSSITVSQIVRRPVRIDRWTGRVEIYLEKGVWEDFAEWNDTKYGKIQSSVRQLAISHE